MAEGERRHVVRFDDREIAALERSLITRSRMLVLVADMCAGPGVDAESDLLAHVAGTVQIHKSCDCGGDYPEPAPPGPRRIIPLEDRHIIRGGDL